MSITNLLEEIRREEIVLPAIQRDFVWSQEKSEKLLDSIMRGYPIGIIFLWETYNDIQHRLFAKDFNADDLTMYHDNRHQKRLKLVLDGQQRLQALYISLHGSYNGKTLFFDILSGRETGDFKEDRFLFRFLSEEEAEKLNNKSISESQSTEDENREAYFYLKVQDLINLGAWDRQKLQQDIEKKLKLSDEDKLRVSFNFSALRDAMLMDRNLLKVTTIDEYKSRESRDRKSESDVLEAFVRINREATPLSRSDLFFSMLKLNWGESTETLPEFVNSINEGNSFNLDHDFVVRCLLGVSDLGTKFDVDLLRKQSNLEKIKTNFSECRKAIQAAIDFVKNDCRITSDKLLKSPNNLIPFIYYFFNNAGEKPANIVISGMRKALYLFAFTSPFSRYADNRLEKFNKEVMKPAIQNSAKKFPLDETIDWVRNLGNLEKYGAHIIENNALLALYLVHGSPKSEAAGTPDVQHIFPASELRKKNFKPTDINHFANLWISNGYKNGKRAKTASGELLSEVPDSELKKGLIDRELLDYKQYKNFLKTREAKIVEYVGKQLGLDE